MKNKVNLFYYIFRNKFVYNETYRNIALMFSLSMIGIIFKIQTNWNQVNKFLNFLTTTLNLSSNQGKSIVYTWALLMSVIMFTIWFTLWKSSQYMKKELLINFSNKLDNHKIKGVVIFTLLNLFVFTFYCIITKQNFLSLIDVQKNHFALIVLLFQLSLMRIYTITISKLSVFLRIGIIFVILYLISNWKTTYKLDIQISLVIMILSLCLSFILNRKTFKRTFVPYQNINANWKLSLISWFRQNKIVMLCIIPTLVAMLILLYFNNKEFVIFINKVSNKNITKETLLILMSISIVIMQSILLLTKTIKYDSQKIYFPNYNQTIYVMMLLFNFVPTVFIFFIRGNDEITLQLNSYIGIIFLLNIVFCFLKSTNIFTPIIISILYVVFLMLIGQKIDMLFKMDWFHKYEKYMIFISYIVVFLINLMIYMWRKKWKK